MSGGTPQISTSPPSYHNFLSTNLSFSERGEPPSYEEAIDPNAPPPSYDSLFGRVREARRTSKGVFEFLKNILIILLGTIGCTIILGVTIVIPICMIVMGSIYLYECPQGEYIPIYLLVGASEALVFQLLKFYIMQHMCAAAGRIYFVETCFVIINIVSLIDKCAGIFGILKQLLHLSSRVRETDIEREEERLRQSPTQTLLNCFMLGWFIIGSVWVYKEFEPNYDPNVPSGRYCNKNLYLFAFWLITSIYILLGIISVCLCSLSIASVVFSSDRCEPAYERSSTRR